MTPISTLSKWFDEGVERGHTHMIVFCDTFNYEDYPKYVTGYHNYRMAISSRDDMTKVMEVYDLRGPKEEQLLERRVHRPPTVIEESHPTKRPDRIEELAVELGKLKSENERLRCLVEAFLQQEQHPLRVFEYVLGVAEFDQRNRRVVIDGRSLLANKLGEDFLKYIQNNREQP